MKTVEQVLNNHDIEVKRGYIPCPSHDDVHPSCKVNEEYVFCFTCHFNADAAGLEAALTDQAVDDVLRSWSKGVQHSPSTRVNKVPKHKQRLNLYSTWVGQSQQTIKNTLNNLPAWYHEAAKEQVWDILDRVMGLWKRSTPYELEQEVAYAEKELQGWVDYWKDITE